MNNNYWTRRKARYTELTDKVWKYKGSGGMKVDDGRHPWMTREMNALQASIRYYERKREKAKMQEELMFKRGQTKMTDYFHVK